MLSGNVGITGSRIKRVTFYIKAVSLSDDWFLP